MSLDKPARETFRGMFTGHGTPWTADELEV